MCCGVASISRAASVAAYMFVFAVIDIAPANQTEAARDRQWRTHGDNFAVDNICRHSRDTQTAATEFTGHVPVWESCLNLEWSPHCFLILLDESRPRDIETHGL